VSETPDVPGLAEKAAALRQSFDRAFARAPADGSDRMEDFLAIRVASDPYAIRLAEIAGLFADRAVTPLPHPVPGMLGIATFSRAIVPVYDLRALLGYAMLDAPRWFVVAATRPVALRFDAYEGHLRLPQDARAPARRPDRARRHVRELVRTAHLVRPIVHLASVLEAIEALPQGGIPKQES